MLKKSLFIIICIAAYFCGVNAQTQELNVTVTDIKEPVGKVYISVFQGKDGYLEEGKEFQKIAVDADGNQVSHTFELPSGEYSVAVFHDKNSDGVCNTNRLGIPTEAFGFSNNFKPKFKAPSFDQTKIDPNQKNVRIALINR